MIILAIIAYLIIAGIVCGIIFDDGEAFEDYDGKVYRTVLMSACWIIWIPLFAAVYVIKLALILPFRFGRKIKEKLDIKF